MLHNPKTIMPLLSAKSGNPLRAGIIGLGKVETQNLASVPTGRRSVTPVPASLLALVPKPMGKNENILESGADPVKDTVPLIRKMVNRQLWQGKKLAAALKRSTVAATVRSNWQFMFNHIQYVPDAEGTEQVKSLRRLIHDGAGDCDDFACALQNLLINQGITNAKFRIAAYNGSSTYSHIYLIVPTSEGKYITLDPVVHRFNYEVPFTSKKDFDMKLQSLDGFGLPELYASQTSAKPKGKIFVVNGKSLEYQGMVSAEKVLAQINLPYKLKSNSNGDAYYEVITSGGVANIPSIVPILEQDNIKAKLLVAAQQSPTLSGASPELTTKQAAGIVLGLSALCLFISSLSGANKGLGAPTKKTLAVVRI